jgi:LEA14-like dessication related protein
MILRYLILSFVALLVLTSCKVNAPEFRGSEGMKLDKIDGKIITFNVTAKVYNPNWFSVKVKRSGVDVFIEDQYMGKLKLEKKVKMKAKRESTLEVPLRAELEDGAMISMLRYSAKETVNLRISGKVKGGIWFFSKKIKVDQTTQIPGKNLRPGGFNLGN